MLLINDGWLMISSGIIPITQEDLWVMIIPITLMGLLITPA